MTRIYNMLVVCMVCSLSTLEVKAQQFKPLDQTPHDISYLRSSKLSSPKVKVTYGRPSTEESQVFGNLVAYDEVWHTGANEATEVKFYEPVLFGSVLVAAGTYSLFTIPGEHDWQIILNTQTDVLGAHFYDPDYNIAQITVQPKIGEYLANFSIGFKPTVNNHYQMILAWERQRIHIPLHFQKKSKPIQFTSIE